MSQDNEQPETLQPDSAVSSIEPKDILAQRQALQARAYSAAGRGESFMSRVPARVRPTTVARLRLLADDPYYGFPLLDEVVDEAIHDYLVKMGD